jgi:hypothetical protein
MNQQTLDQLLLEIREIVVSHGINPMVIGVNIGITKSEFARIKARFPDNPINEVTGFQTIRDRDVLAVSLPIITFD